MSSDRPIAPKREVYVDKDFQPTIPKRHDEVLYHEIDWEDVLAPLSDAIDTSTWTSNGPAISSPGTSGSKAYVTIGVGTGSVKNVIDTTGGKTYEREYRVKGTDRNYLYDDYPID